MDVLHTWTAPEEWQAGAVYDAKSRGPPSSRNGPIRTASIHRMQIDETVDRFLPAEIVEYRLQIVRVQPAQWKPRHHGKSLRSHFGRLAFGINTITVDTIEPVLLGPASHAGVGFGSDIGAD